MKRSTNVALTLLVPAMAAFGCGHSTPNVNPPAAHQISSDCGTPAKPGEPAKPQCTPAPTQHTRYGGSHGFWFGGSRSGTAAPAPSHGATGTSSVAHGGFGSSGAHFSGGS